MAFGVQTSSLDSTTPSGFGRSAEVEGFRYDGGPKGNTDILGLRGVFGFSASPKETVGSVFTQAIDPNAASQKTLMQTINPGTDYKATMPSGQITFDSDKAVTTGASAAQKVGAAEVSVDENKKQFTADFKDAREQLCKAIVQNVGPDKAAGVLDALGAFDEPQTKLGVAVSATVQSSAIFTALAVIAAVQKESGAENKPTEEEVIQVLADAKRALSSQDSPESKMAQMSSGAPAPKEPEKKFNWEAANTDHLKALVAGRPEDQPEMVTLDRQEKFLADVRGNHKFVQENYALSPTYDKVKAGGGFTDYDAAKVLVESGMQTQLAEMSPSTPKYDSGSVYTTGYFMRDLDMSALKVSPPLPSVKEVAEAMNPSLREQAFTLMAPEMKRSMLPQNLFG